MLVSCMIKLFYSAISYFFYYPNINFSWQTGIKAKFCFNLGYVSSLDAFGMASLRVVDSWKEFVFGEIGVTLVHVTS